MLGGSFRGEVGKSQCEAFQPASLPGLFQRWDLLSYVLVSLVWVWLVGFGFVSVSIVGQLSMRLPCCLLRCSLSCLLGLAVVCLVCFALDLNVYLTEQIYVCL